MSERKVLFSVIAVIVVAAIVAVIALAPVIAIVTVIALIIVAVLAFIYLPLVLPKATSLVVSPSSFTLTSGESMALTATPRSDGLTLTGTGTTWVASIGSFDRTSGSVVIYTVSEVAEPTSVAITASFPGVRPYRPSKATIPGTIVPKKAEATTLAVSPSTFEVDSGNKITLNAALSPTNAPSKQISWELDGPGTLSSASGESTTYAAPESKEKATVKITAAFAGTREYLGSRAESHGTIISVGVVVRSVATLVVTPSSFAVGPGGNVALGATLEDEAGNVLVGKTISWNLEGPGTLSSTTGPIVAYEAPNEVKNETAVTILAEFQESDQFLRTSALIAGTVTQASIKEFSYEMKFEKLTVNNAELRGPIAMLGVNVVEIAGGLANVSKMALSPLGLNALGASFENMRMYTTLVKAYSPELGKELEITGDHETKMSMGTLTLENGVASIVYLTGTNVGLMKPGLVGKYVGGDEPYTPVIATAHKVTLEQGYSVQGPMTYEKLVNGVNNLMSGKIGAIDFTFTCPLNYRLDRVGKEHSYKTKWTLSASGLTGQNPSILFVYFATTYGGFIVKGTGDQSPSTLIPHGFSAGWKSPPLPDAQVHAVSFTADQLALRDVVIQIAP